MAERLDKYILPYHQLLALVLLLSERLSKELGQQELVHRSTKLQM